MGQPGLGGLWPGWEGLARGEGVGIGRQAWFRELVLLCAGYRLAFNHLRAHRCVDAMLVCHKILEEYPQYPRIQKEILDKARASVKS